MNWDRGFKRLYITLTVLFLIGSAVLSYYERDSRIEVPYKQELEKNKDYHCISWKNTVGKLRGSCYYPNTLSEQLLSALETFSQSLLIWVC